MNTAKESSTEEHSRFYARRLTKEISKVDKIIQNINKVASEAIKTLEDQKNKILEESQHEFEIKPQEIQEDIEEITEKKDIVMDKYKVILDRKESLNVQSEKIFDLDKQLKIIEDEREEAIEEFVAKKNYLEERLRSIQDFDMPVVDLGLKKESETVPEEEILVQALEGEIEEEEDVEEEGGLEEEEEEIVKIEPFDDYELNIQKLRDFLYEPAKKKKEEDYCVCTPCSTSSESSSTSSEGPGTSRDALYLQRTVGAALRLSIAEVVMKKPRDPIHYLAHLLFKFRLNIERNAEKAKEIYALTQERIRLENIRNHDMYTSTAQATILDLIIKAEQEMIERHLRELEEMEEGSFEDVA